MYYQENAVNNNTVKRRINEMAQGFEDSLCGKFISVFYSSFMFSIRATRKRDKTKLKQLLLAEDLQTDNFKKAPFNAFDLVYFKEK